MDSLGSDGRNRRVGVNDAGATPLAADRQGGSSLGKAARRQPLLLIGAIGAGLGLAELLPGVADAMAPLVNGGVFVLLYLVMLGLDLRGVAGAFSERRFLRIAVTLNFVINPLLAWALGALFLDGHPDLRTGLILFLVTPCIGWYLIFTELAGGDTALGVSLLAVNLILQILLLPFYLWLFEGDATVIDLPGIVQSVLVFLVVPAGAAVATRALAERGGRDIVVVQDAIGRAHLKTVALVVVIIAMFASQADVIFDNPGSVLTLLPAMAGFFVVAFAIALATARAAQLPYDQAALLAFTATSRNSEASLAIAATAFASPLVALTVVVGPVIELPFLLLMVRVLLAAARSWPQSRGGRLRESPHRPGVRRAAR